MSPDSNPSSVFQDMLVQSLHESTTSGPTDTAQFSAARFFDSWFRVKGKAYFFLFQKNLRVTNIQFAELLALIRLHTTMRNREPAIQDFRFLSVEEFYSSANSIVQAHSAYAKEEASERHRNISQLHADLLSRTIVLHCFFGSCAVFVPPQLTIDLAAVCADAGYVHSCGYSIYIRNMYKARKEEFFNSLEKYLDTHLTTGKSAFFTIYGHEDFSDYDEASAAELRDGLEDVKVSIEKCYMGSDDLVSILKSMRNRFGDRLVIPEAQDYRKQRRKVKNKVDPSRTLWLIVERSISENPRNPGEKRYFICYDQLVRNENPLHLFDENKPAWIDHTTIPHTLLGAMQRSNRVLLPSVHGSWRSSNGTTLCNQKGRSSSGSPLFKT
jgi:hypothetical protein